MMDGSKNIELLRAFDTKLWIYNVNAKGHLEYRIT